MRIVVLLLALLMAVPADAAEVLRLQKKDFKASAGRVTFREHPRNTRAPSYGPEAFGGGPTAPNVRTGGWFLGQALSRRAGRDCPGAAPSACVVGTPRAPLRLDTGAPKPFITHDGAFPTSPTLSGSPRFNGPIALWFDKDQVGVGFDGGIFDARRSVGITAFGRDGRRLGTISNAGTGVEFLGLVTADGQPKIAGVMLELVGAEPQGFNIDNLRFGAAEDIELPEQVKLPPPPPPLVECCH
ncbi:PEP-CTERM sorting domain-containing protein [Rhodovulum sp. DZ06]|uniref:PEP-CTERM sorting domain-containing protein n=1 Tax=Rhodovulum sp. DZ06 TaxID=3425126 RepID=UPI003D32AC5F